MVVTRSLLKMSRKFDLTACGYTAKREHSSRVFISPIRAEKTLPYLLGYKTGFFSSLD